MTAHPPASRSRSDRPAEPVLSGEGIVAAALAGPLPAGTPEERLSGGVRAVISGIEHTPVPDRPCRDR
ncbi:hypothetical protein ABZ719_08675 [Streptomyces sp. NPDC006743]|uniref:hypothetical protein n=1 Tax=Streptomyces sp. NPDC006743 TaxID=3154480 RepID=UPI0034564ADC